MRNECKKRTLELFLIQGFSKSESFFGGATSTIKVKVLSLKVNLNKPYITDNQLY